jgi:hypothetical protein
MTRLQCIVAAALALTPVVAFAQAAPPVCAGPATPPPAYAALASMTDLPAATDAAGLPHAELTLGRAINARLRPASTVAFVMPPEKATDPADSAGLFQFDIAATGVYRVALGAAAWIDMVKDGKAVESIAHSPGPACSGIRKLVDFQLEPGRYVLQLSDNPGDRLTVLIQRPP